jgi:hypothetical protein
LATRYLDLRYEYSILQMRLEPWQACEISRALIDSEQTTLQAPLICTNDFIDRFARTHQMQHYNLTYTPGTATSRYSTLHGAADHQYSHFDKLTVPDPHSTSLELGQPELSTLHILTYLDTDSHTHILLSFQASYRTMRHQQCKSLRLKVLDFLCHAPYDHSIPRYHAQHHAHTQPTSPRDIEYVSLAVTT